MSRLSQAASPVHHSSMETKMTQQARQAVMAATQRLDSEERVSAFLAQSRMMVAVYQAGRALNRRSRRSR